MASIDSSQLESVDISSIRSPQASTLRTLLDAAYREQLKEKLAKAEKERLLKEADALRKKLKLPGKIQSESWTTVHSLKLTRTIKKEKLLEKGVSMQIIDECTVATPSESFYVQGRKTKEE